MKPLSVVELLARASAQQPIITHSQQSASRSKPQTSQRPAKTLSPNPSLVTVSNHLTPRLTGDFRLAPPLPLPKDHGRNVEALTLRIKSKAFTESSNGTTSEHTITTRQYPPYSTFMANNRYMGFAVRSQAPSGSVLPASAGAPPLVPPSSSSVPVVSAGVTMSSKACENTQAANASPALEPSGHVLSYPGLSSKSVSHSYIMSVTGKRPSLLHCTRLCVGAVT